MDFTNIFKMQKALDQTILNNIAIEKSELQISRLLALIVEISEFANEISSFKYWKKHKKLQWEKVVEEFVDGIHFFCSLAMELNLSPIIKSKIVSQNINQQFLAVFKSIIDLTKKYKNKNIATSFSLYLGLARLCQISNEDIENFYVAKNKINYQRVANNY